MRKSSLILLLAMAFVLTTVATGFSSSVVDGPCKELCKTWGYNLHLKSAYSCDEPYQGTATCPPCPQFDYESALGYCGSNGGGDNYYNAAGVIFKVCDCPDVTFDINKSYGIKIEIVEPATGVYFVNRNDSGAAYASCATGCPNGDQNIYVSSLGDTNDESRFCPNPCDGTPFAMGYVPLNSSEVLFDSSIHDKTDGTECCLDCVGNLAKSVKTDCLQPFMFTASPYIMIDIPTMVWDPKIMADGDEVVIKVTIFGEGDQSVCPTCNDLCNCTIKIGEFGCPKATVADACTTCFPYFPALDDTWWAGFVLTNAGSDNADVKMTFTAGGVDVTINETVSAHSVLVKGLSEYDLSALDGKGGIYAQAVSTVPLANGGTKAAMVTGLTIMGDSVGAYGYLTKDGACGCCSDHFCSNK